MSLLLRKRPEVDETPEQAPAPVPTVLLPVVLPSVNLLPPEIQERRRFREVQLGLAGAVVGCVGLMGLLFIGASGSVSDAQAELDVAAATGQQLTVEGAKYGQITNVQLQAEAAKGRLATAMGQEIRFSEVLSDLSTALPETVWLQSVTVTQTPAAPATSGAAPAPPGTPPAPAAASTPAGTVTFSGKGFSHDDVAAWLDAMAATPDYADPYFSRSAESLVGTRKVVTFESTATLTSSALSRRYTQAGG
jgi:Tfp pilus assembly protein PilN